MLVVEQRFFANGAQPLEPPAALRARSPGIGLTRTPFDGNIAEVEANDQEIDWMIAETNRCLPKLAITRDAILFSWAGVNPLTRDPEDPLGSREIDVHDLAADGLLGAPPPW